MDQWKIKIGIRTAANGTLHETTRRAGGWLEAILEAVDAASKVTGGTVQSIEAKLDNA